MLAELLHINDELILIDISAAFASVSDGMSDQIQAVLDSGIAQRLVQLLSNNSIQVKFSCRN